VPIIDEPSPSIVPPIVVSASLNDHAVHGPVDSGASSIVSPRVVQRAKFRTRPTVPSLLHQALLSKTPVRISEHILANVKLADGFKTKKLATFKVAPLASHEVIFGMPFLAENHLLIDPAARKFVPRTVNLGNYVKVGNALMKLPTPEVQSEEINSLVEEPPEYASLNDFFMKEFPDVFTLKRSGRLPPKGGPMHRIVLKDDKKPING